MGVLGGNIRAAGAYALALVCALALVAASASKAVAAEAPTITLRSVPQPSSDGFETDPGIAPDADGQGELFSLSGLQGSFGELLEASPSGTLTPVGSSYDAQFLSSVVDADGLDWLLTGEGLMAISAGGAVTNFQIPLPAATDMALGPEGDLYIANTDDDDILKCVITAKPSASCGTSILIPSTFASQQPESITSAGGSIWFTTAAGELGSLSTGGSVDGPFDEHTSSFSDGPAGPNDNMLAAAPNGTLWTTAVARDGDNDSELVEINSSTGAVIARYGPAQGLTASANVEGLTVGPDGNVWFIDSGGAGSVGVLDTSDGRVTEFPFPSGYAASLLIPSGISPGPNDTVWFSATTAALGSPAIGEITGLAAAGLEITRTASVLGYRSVALHVTCRGPSGAGCAGKLSVAVLASTRGQSGVNDNPAPVMAHRTATLGPTHYDVAAGHSATINIPLGSEAKRLLKAARGHGLSGAVIATPQIGSPSHFTVSITA